MKICIHRGSHQIGGSCVKLEAHGRRLLLDLGLPLEAEANTVDLLPAIPGLTRASENLLGVLVSHPHMDHYSLLKHIRPELPLAMGAAGPGGGGPVDAGRDGTGPRARAGGS